MEIIKKDILSISQGIIAHQVNCKKVMGGGLAAQIKKKWPIVYTTYMARRPVLGDCDLVQITDDLYVANLYGQDAVGPEQRQTNYGALGHALHMLTMHLYDIHTVIPNCFPYGMGCGLGGGSWNIVSELIEFHFPDAYICKLE